MYQCNLTRDRLLLGWTDNYLVLNKIGSDRHERNCLNLRDFGNRCAVSASVPSLSCPRLLKTDLK